MGLFGAVLGDSNERVVKKLAPLAEEITMLENKLGQFSDAQLREKTEELKNRLKKGEKPDDVLPEAFSLVRESSKRTLGQRHFDAQLVGGAILHRGQIAEMRTGEGKTLAATLPAYLNALTEEGVHIVTVNDYLARRDTVWMGQIYHLLGLSVGCLNHEQAFVYDPTYQQEKIQNSETDGERDTERDTIGSFKVIESYLRPVSRAQAYAADITHGTNNEFGFDYLRSNMAYQPDQVIQKRLLSYAIIDEVDSILIDEARTPLIISAPDENSTKMYQEFSRIIPHLRENEHFNIDEKMRAATLTEEGIGKVEKILGVSNIYEERGIRLVHHLEQALRAQVLFRRDRDYVVKDGEVIIVDEFTGRLMPGRRYSGGLHQAIEAKEGVQVQQESRTLATITFQNYFRMYKKIAGMTGTAVTNAEEFHKVYKLDVVVVPTNKPMIRKDLPDRIYKTEEAKFNAIVEEIKTRNTKGQPILVGTVSIEKNEYLGALLKREGISHEILNAKHHEREAEIIAQAGRFGAVTIATNMAGRGVDIILGGNPSLPDEADKIREVGGLHVIGTERHEARRIDNQLRGRSGRQGDPGSSQFFLSLEDDIMRIFGGDRIKNLMTTLKLPEDHPIEHSLVSKAIESAQSKIEGYNFDTRKHVLEYDDVMNVQRSTIYKERKEILSSQSVHEKIKEFFKDEIEQIVGFHAREEHYEKWNIKEIGEIVMSMVPAAGDITPQINDIREREALRRKLLEIVEGAYERKENEIGKDVMREAEKMILLRTLDMFWMDHLEQMEHLRDSVRLRAYGQRDPLVEYKNEGHRLFKDLLVAIRVQVTRSILKVELKERSSAPQEREMQSRGPQKVGGGGKKIGRNDPCPCGAGKKYKRCHGS